MAGILLVSGQAWVIDQMKAGIDTLGGLYVGLMTNPLTPNEEEQVGSGIVEFNDSSVGSGYNRELCQTWVVVSGVDPYLSGETVTFLVSGVWEDVRGYFVATGATSGVGDVLWAEPLPVEKQGDKVNGSKIYITPLYEQRYHGE